MTVQWFVMLAVIYFFHYPLASGKMQTCKIRKHCGDTSADVMGKVRSRGLSPPHMTAQSEPLHRLHAISAVYGIIAGFFF